MNKEANLQRMILDCDPGIGPGLDADDVLALLFAIASPELRLEGVTTVFGNVEVRRATDNALRTLEAAGRLDVPVAMGMGSPLSGRLHPRGEAEYEHHRKLLGPVDDTRVDSGRHALHASDFIISKVNEHPGEVAIVAVGSLTNVAMALLKEPSLKEKIRQIAIMGGAFAREPKFGRGNITPVAEYNIWNDPLAADIVFESGIPLTAVGLDVTNPAKGTVMYEDQLLGLVRQKSLLSAFLYDVCKTYIDTPKFNWAKKGCLLYDPLVVATLVDRSLVTTERSRVRVETVSELTRGQTVAFPTDDGTVDVCVEVNGAGFVELFVSRLQALVDRSVLTAARK
ncbi:nucleoside hydrolase [Paraburkholderia sp. MM5482-R1]|uniref:nucleoside hydrolase n=1 Tax=unclassified Paraburkholderia TaxID=2615204 RepID=UPI003D1B4DAB